VEETIMEELGKPGTEQALVERFVKQELPKVLDLKTKVDGGAKLTDVELDLLSGIIEKAHNYEQFLHYWPKYKPVIAQILDTYNEITTKALENEQSS
jgi:hypothetical protein